jgi:hypothetical protein
MWDWLNCVVLFRHEYGIWCQDGSIFLRCVRCGHRSEGWDVAGDKNAGTGSAGPHRHRRVPFLGRLAGAFRS